MPAELPPIGWIEPASNPWGVRLLDVRPVTQGMLSTSSDPQCAANAVSFGQDDGSSFAGMEPNSARTVNVSLRYRVAGTLADGPLFTPACMEHKWAIFYRGGKILFVRSWTRELFAVAEAQMHGDQLELTAVRGDLVAENEEAQFKTRVVDYILRSHALNLVYPAPLLPEFEQDPGRAALWCFHCFGDRALYATPDVVPYEIPEQLLVSC